MPLIVSIFRFDESRSKIIFLFIFFKVIRHVMLMLQYSVISFHTVISIIVITIAFIIIIY